MVRFAEFARQEPYVIRFIEFMPLDADRTWSRDKRAAQRGRAAR